MLNPSMMLVRGSVGSEKLVRDVSGRLYAGIRSPDAITGFFPAFNIADWTNLLSGGPAPSIVIGTDNLAFVAAGASPGTRSYYINTISVRATAMIFTRIASWSRTSILALPLLRADIPNAAFPTQAIYAVTRNSTLDSFNLIERVSSATVQQNLTALAIGTPSTLGLRAKGDVANAWSTIGPANRTLTGLGLTGTGRVGMGVQNFSGNTTSIFVEHSRIGVHADDVLTVTGTVGIRVRLLDAGNNVLASVDAGDGNASINLWDIRATYCPEVLPLATKIQIFDLATLTLQAESEPVERLWGGDAWTYTH